MSSHSDPEIQVSRHLSKLFDSLCKLKFHLDASGKPLKFGLGMYSKEDEYVDFDQECDLSGQVRAAAGTHRPLSPGMAVPRGRDCMATDGQCQQQPRPTLSPLPSASQNKCLRDIFIGVPAQPYLCSLR